MIKNDITIVTAFFDIGRGNVPNVKNGVSTPSYVHAILQKTNNDKFYPPSQVFINGVK